MNPLILVGFDLAASAALILLAMYVVWSRVRIHLESLGGGRDNPAVESPIPRVRQDAGACTEEPSDEWAFGGITEQATSLKKKGCSTEQIAQRLQLPTREVEMVLAISEMGNGGKAGRGVHVPFAPEPEVVRPT